MGMVMRVEVTAICWWRAAETGLGPVAQRSWPLLYVMCLPQPSILRIDSTYCIVICKKVLLLSGAETYRVVMSSALK